MTRMAKIGIFFLAAIIAGAIFLMKTIELFNVGDTYELHAVMDDASGLLKDSKIMIAGVVVGKLKKIGLSAGKAHVTLEIIGDIDIYQDAILEKKMESMIGTAALHIDPGIKKNVLLKNGDYIKNVISEMGLNVAMDKAKSAAIKLDQIADGINQFVSREGFQKKMDDLIDFMMKTSKVSAKNIEINLIYMRRLMKNMAEISEEVNKRSEQEMDKASQLLSNTIGLTNRLDKLLGANDKNITDSMTAIKQSLTSLNEQIKASQKAIDDMRALTGNVKDISDKINKGEGTVGKLLTDEKLYRDFSNVMEQVSDYADSTIGIDIDVDFHSEFNTIQKDFKNYASLRLSPRKDRYYMLGIVQDPEGSTTTTDTTTNIATTTAAGTVNETVTEHEVEKTDKIKLSLQIARKFGPVTLRGGVFENSGGGAIDYIPSKYISFSAEAFDFTGDTYPTLRAVGNVYPLLFASEPFNWIYVTAGADDLLRKDYRDFFIGAGVTFTDNDLKGVVSSVPKP